MTYARKRTVLRTSFEDTPTSSACSVSARVSPLTEASDMDFGSNEPTLPPGKKVRKRFVLQAMAKTESLLPAHPWNCGYRTWATWGKRFHLRKSAEQALNSARNQHGHRLHFRIVESSR